MLKVGIKYCGGCNPDYDRVALFKMIEERLKGKIKFVFPEGADINLVLVIEGCKTACADLTSFDGKIIFKITQSEDAKYFIQKILDGTTPRCL